MSVTEESTNTVLKTITSDSGDYMVNYLKPGSYKVQFASPGFKEHLETGRPAADQPVAPRRPDSGSGTGDGDGGGVRLGGAGEPASRPRSAR